MASDKVYLDTKKLKYFLKKNGLTYSKVSIMCGRNQAAFSQIMKNGYATKSFYTLMCNILEQPEDAFLLVKKEEKKEKVVATPGKTIFSSEKMVQYLEKKNMDVNQAAEKFGFTAFYFSQLLTAEEMPSVTYNFICKMLGVEETEFLKESKEDATESWEARFDKLEKLMIEQSAGMNKMIMEQATELQSIKELLKTVASDISKIGNLAAVIVSKNKDSETKLTELIDSVDKVHAKLSSATEQKRPDLKTIIKDAIQQKGYLYEKDVQDLAKKHHFTEDDLEKVKKELGIDVTFSGQGVNRKEVWRIPRL